MAVIALCVSLASFFWTRREFRRELRIVARHAFDEASLESQVILVVLNPTRRDVGLLSCGFTLHTDADSQIDVVARHLDDSSVLGPGRRVSITFDWDEVFAIQKKRAGDLMGVWIEDDGGKRHRLGLWADMLPTRDDDHWTEMGEKQVYEVGRSGNRCSQQPRRVRARLDREHRDGLTRPRFLTRAIGNRLK